MAVTAFDRASDAAASVLVGQDDQFTTALDVLNQYTQKICEAHANVSLEIHNVCSSSVADSRESLEQLATKAAKLEEAFARIDDLQVAIDAINESILQVNGVLKTVDKPADMKEKAASLFQSIGFGRKAKDEGFWQRVPMHIMIDGHSVIQFREKIRAICAPFDALRLPPSQATTAAATAQ